MACYRDGHQTHTSNQLLCIAIEPKQKGGLRYGTIALDVDVKAEKRKKDGKVIEPPHADMTVEI